MAYKDDVPQTEGMGRYSGVLLTNPGMPHVIEKPGDKGRTVFRIFPEMSNGEEMPWRLNAEPCNFSYWLFAERLMLMAGVNDKFSCICRVKGKDRNYQGPIDKFVMQLRKAMKDSPTSFPAEWLKWTISSLAGGTGALPTTDVCGLMQGALVENKGKKYTGPDGRSRPIHPVLLITKRSAREAIERQCNQEVQGYAGQPEDYSSRFVSGDVCSLKAGRLLQLLYVPSGKDPNTGAAMFAHYQANFLPQTWPLDKAKAMVSNEWKPWDKLLRYLTDEEQMELLVKHYPAEAVSFVFENSAWNHLVPSHVRGKWNQLINGVRVAVPSAPAPTAPAPTPPAPQNYGTSGTFQPPANQQYTPPIASAPVSTPPWNNTDSLDGPDMSGENEFDLSGAVDNSAGQFNDSLPSNANVNPPVTSAAASIPFNAPPPSPQSDPLGTDERQRGAMERINAARAAMAAATKS